MGFLQSDALATLLTLILGAAGLWAVLGEVVKRRVSNVDNQQANDAIIRGELWREVKDIRVRNDELQKRIAEAERGRLDGDRKASERDIEQQRTILGLTGQVADLREQVAELRRSIAALRACPDCPLK
jgi:Skp family chaperone for outer membrane proteins